MQEKLVKKTENSIELIKKSGILTKKDIETLSSLAPELKDTFLKVQMFRTPTEMRVSVLNDVKHPTPDSKYWQSVREQNVMYTETINMSYEYRKEQVELKKLIRKLETEPDDLERELLKIQIEQKEWQMINMEKTAKARIGELAEWSAIKAELEQDMNFSKENVDQHQLMSYTSRWINQFFIMGDTGTPGERQNLIGQMNSGLKRISDLGLMEEFIGKFDEVNQEELREFIIEQGFLEPLEKEIEFIMEDKREDQKYKEF